MIGKDRTFFREKSAEKRGTSARAEDHFVMDATRIEILQQDMDSMVTLLVCATGGLSAGATGAHGQLTTRGTRKSGSWYVPHTRDVRAHKRRLCLRAVEKRAANHVGYAEEFCRCSSQRVISSRNKANFSVSPSDNANASPSRNTARACEIWPLARKTPALRNTRLSCAAGVRGGDSATGWTFPRQATATGLEQARKCCRKLYVL